MQIDDNTGLVLEGGGMRGVFTSGVLDAFMKHEVYFNYIVAVSAGACNGMSYVSRQPRRARISNIDYLARYNYIGLRHLVTQGCIFDQDLLYNKFPNQYLPSTLIHISIILQHLKWSPQTATRDGRCISQKERETACTGYRARIE